MTRQILASLCHLDQIKNVCYQNQMKQSLLYNRG